ncbi:CGNR zinc finger domain-containing protein [Mycobacterium montefiorense]|uniref:CGNR zinc finger domain-containing protein n=1 Tax=Mycobacterium montefiorense TaxID=154654 RepID=UPI0021F39B78|nr:ABATE domain-containing protein [Mycobacterium montefiorense]
MTRSAPAWVLPGEPAAVRFMNTIWADTSGSHDDLTTPSALREWIAVVAERDAKSFGRIGVRDVVEARLLRDAVRRLAAFCTQDDRAAAQSIVDNIDDAISSVNAAVSHRPAAWIALRGDQLQRERPTQASPIRTALAELAHDAIDLLTGPTSATLRACHAPGCVLYFVKTHPRREWCSEACGNRVRAARHYQRSKAYRSR